MESPPKWFELGTSVILARLSCSFVSRAVVLITPIDENGLTLPSLPLKIQREEREKALLLCYSLFSPKNSSLPVESSRSLLRSCFQAIPLAKTRGKSCFSLVFPCIFLSFSCLGSGFLGFGGLSSTFPLSFPAAKHGCPFYGLMGDSTYSFERSRTFFRGFVIYYPNAHTTL